VTAKPQNHHECVTIIVRPSAAHPELLTIHDAMRQVSDFFEILTPDEQSGGGLVWKLSIASTNSPLTVVGQAASFDPAIDVTMIARLQKQAAAEQLRSLAAGRRPISAISKRCQPIYRRIMQRNINGIGQTDAIFDGLESAIFITPDSAASAIDALTREESAFDALLLTDRGREEIGSIEGHLLEVGTNYNKPAILVRERTSGAEVWCLVDAGLKEKISQESRFEDVWDHKRVIVRGRISFNKQGAIVRVLATSVTGVSPRQMTLNDIKDPNFTDGLSAVEYLERLREGELGG